MPRPRLVRRNLSFYWRTNLATALGVAVGAATLTGALLVGDSMRGSLRDLALARLGRVDQAILPPRFIPAEFAATFDGGVPAIMLPGGVTHADSGARAEQTQVIGIDGAFAAVAPVGTAFVEPRGQEVVLNAALAREIGAKPGDDVLIRLGKPSDISRETLMGRRDDTTASLRLTVSAIAPPGMGDFSLTPSAQAPRTAFVALSALQRALGQPRRVNTILLTGSASLTRTTPAPGAGAPAPRITLALAGLKLRADAQHGCIVLESNSILLEPALESAARAAAMDMKLACAGVYVYLANRIERVPSDSQPASTSGEPVPYSTVAGIERVAGLAAPDGAPVDLPGPDDILINDWAAAELNATPGQRLRLTYFVTGDFGQIVERSTEFTLRSVVRLAGAAADPGLAPEYPGVTDSDAISDWDPPFPIDLDAIRDRDEAYWDDHRATPKAFVQLARAQALWAEKPEQLGRLTSLRFYPPSGQALDTAATGIEEAILKRLDLQQLGLAPLAIRASAVAAGGGATDFGGLFIGFSFFLIASSAMLVALLFRLGVERRAPQLGLLLATGHSRRRVTWLLCGEGLAVAAIGAALGLPGAVGYAWFMLAGLRTWWSAATTAPSLTVHLSLTSFVIGYAVSVLVAGAAIWLAVRGLASRSPRALLAGAVQAGWGFKRGRAPFARIVAVAASILAGAQVICGIMGIMAPPVAFFGGAALLLVAGLAWLRVMLAAGARRTIDHPGFTAFLRLGMRNARRNPGRSLLTAGLIASATFLITALSAMRLEAPGGVGNRESGTGGFALLAESAAPLLFDLNTPEGREALGVGEEAAAALDEAHVYAFRLRPGDETSCLNLYQPGEPRILGATPAFSARGGFSFAAALAPQRSAGGRDVKANPWVLLEENSTDGVIPAIGDEAAVVWQLKSGLGREIAVHDERGRPARVRFVALLRGSALQGEIIVSEQNFARLYPNRAGYSLFLVEARPEAVQALPGLLERELAPFALDVTATTDRIRAFAAVQNTYISAFQTLGGLGLVLGTAGLGAVLLRGVWERRGELALLRALGYSRAALGWMVLAENLLLVTLGLLAGVVPALLALAPQLVARAGEVPWLNLALTWVAVFATAALACALAMRPALRTPLLPALRSE